MEAVYNIKEAQSERVLGESGYYRVLIDSKLSVWFIRQMDSTL